MDYLTIFRWGLYVVLLSAGSIFILAAMMAVFFPGYM